MSGMRQVGGQPASVAKTFLVSRSIHPSLDVPTPTSPVSLLPPPYPRLALVVGCGAPGELAEDAVGKGHRVVVVGLDPHRDELHAGALLDLALGERGACARIVQ